MKLKWNEALNRSQSGRSRSRAWYALTVLLGLWISAGAQFISLTGTVVDNETSQGIEGATVKIVEIPECSTETDGDGSFALIYGTARVFDTPQARSLTIGSFRLHGSRLTVSDASPALHITVDVYDYTGSRIRRISKNAGLNGTAVFADLWKSPGVYGIVIEAAGLRQTLLSVGTGPFALFTEGNRQNILSKSSAANYTLEVAAAGYAGKHLPLTETEGSLDTIALSRPLAGTGTNYQPSYLTEVTGGGPMPDTTDGYICDCDGTGETDATDCLQEAADAAATQGRPLLIPSTPDFYSISGRVTIRGSVFGIGAGMPTIKQTADCGSASCQGLRLAKDMTGWVSNLHIIGMYRTSPNGEYAHNISVGGVNGVTIRGNLLETPNGDNISDNSQEQDGVPARNVLVDNNTLSDPLRCNISMTNVSDGWVFVNNKLSYNAGYVDPVDLEPWKESSHVTNVEFAYNKVTSPGEKQQYYGVIIDCDDWFDKTPGGNVYRHHNYGTWGVPFAGSSETWFNIVTKNNVEGDTPPLP